MKVRWSVWVSAAPLAVACAAATTTGCDVHEGVFSGEFNAGAADPFNFPPPYRGADAQRQVPASGVFREVAAYVDGQQVGYFSFPFAPSQVETTGYPPPAAGQWPGGVIDPLRVTGPGTDFRGSLGNPVPVPLAYVFDAPNGTDGAASAGSSDDGGTSATSTRESTKCKTPANYTFDSFAEAFPKSEQWNVVTFLPDRFASFPQAGLPTWNYRPVVAQVDVTTGDLECQSSKSERSLLGFADQGRVTMTRAEPEPDKTTRFGLPTPGKFLAWALIDPGSAVLRVGQSADVLAGGSNTGTTVQRYGWYGQFIAAYIDGGSIPVEPGPDVNVTPTDPQPTTRMRAQRLYYPRTAVIRGSTTQPAGALGEGYDVLQGNRFAGPSERYSPVCEVWTYALPAPTAVEDLPKDEATILAIAGSTLEPARTSQTPGAYTPNARIVPRYIFCLQAAPLNAPASGSGG